MKLRYFIPTLIAAIAMFVGCTSDDDPIYLDNIHVSTSYVTFAKEGTPVDITLTAAADWSIDEASVPEWLKITPMSGGAGEQTLKFSPEAGDSRSGIVKINCGGQTQEIIVEQELVDPDPITVSQALAVIRSGNIPSSALKVTGIVCKIQEISTSYGNATYFLSDDGSYGSDNWLEVYRGYWLDGEKFTDENAFSVGDELTIKGVLMLYNNSVPETVQGTASVVAIKKSLIKVDSLDVAELPIEGGIVTAALTCKGNGITVDIPAEAQNWLSVVSVDTQNGAVKFKAQPNTGGDRNTTVNFKTVSGGKEYSASAVVAQKGAILEVAVKDFLAAAVGDTQYRLTGVVMELYTSDSQGQSFYIQDYSGKALVYRAAGFKESGAKVGDVVTVVGKRGAYNGAPQLTSGTFEKLNYAVTEVSIAEFLTKADDPNTYYKVTGTVDEIANPTYGNLYIKDGDARVYSYGCYPGWGATGDNRKNCLANKGIEVGDKLTLIGVKSTYNGTVQINGGIYFAHEKAAAPQPEDTPGSLAKPFTIAEAMAYIDASGADEVYVQGVVSKVVYAFDADHGTGTFWISTDGTFNDDKSKDFEAYSVYWLGNKSWVDGNGQVAVGDKVVLHGKLTSYKGTYETSSKKAYVYSLNGQTE